MHIANLSSLLVLFAAVSDAVITFEYQGKSGALNNGLLMLAADNAKEAFFEAFGEVEESDPLQYLNFDQMTPLELANVHPSLLRELGVKQLESVLGVAKRMTNNKAATASVAPLLHQTMELLSEAPAQEVHPSVRNAIMKAARWEACNPFTIVTAPGFRFTRTGLRRVFAINDRAVISADGNSKSVRSMLESGRGIMADMGRHLITLLNKVIDISTSAYELYFNIRRFIPPALLEVFPRLRAFLESFDTHLSAGVNIRSLSIWARDIIESSLQASAGSQFATGNKLASGNKLAGAKRPVSAADFDSLEAEPNTEANGNTEANFGESLSPRIQRRRTVNEEEEVIEFDDRNAPLGGESRRRQPDDFTFDSQEEDDEPVIAKDEEEDNSHFDEAVSTSYYHERRPRPLRQRRVVEDEEDQFVSMYSQSQRPVRQYSNRRAVSRRVEYPERRESRSYATSEWKVRRGRADSGDEYDSNSSGWSFSYESEE